MSYIITTSNSPTSDNREQDSTAEFTQPLDNLIKLEILATIETDNITLQHAKKNEKVDRLK